MLELIVLGCVLIANGAYKYKLRKDITYTPTSKTRSMAMGLVELKGKVANQNTTYTSPIGQKECVYYYWNVQKRKLLFYWEHVRGEGEGRKFYLKDKTGLTQVDLGRATKDFKTTYTKRLTPFSKTPEHIAKILQKRPDLPATSWTGGLRMQEQILSPGEEVFVIGTAEDNPEIEDGTETQEYKDILITRGKEHRKLFITNRNEQQARKRLQQQAILNFIGGLLCFVIVGFALP